MFLLLANVLFATFSYAQLPCFTDEMYRKMLKENPGLEDFQKQFNEQLRLGIASKTSSTADTTTYDIPIVVHVIHDYGTEYLADNVIYDAAAYWAEVYMAHNTDTSDVIAPFKKYVGDPRMRLHLATKDPNGHPTKGVTHYQSYLQSNADDKAKFDQWDPTKYVNIWFIGTFGAAATGAAAYAIFPSAAVFTPYYDGIIALSSYCGYAKTVPHEMGHVLNLEHPWGNTNSPTVACGDDGVDDTPPTKGHNPVGCTLGALYDTACATGYMVHYTATGGGDSLVNYPDTVNAQNIMDYTYCQRMFTNGQVTRMKAALTSSVAGRNNLYSPTNLSATGALAPMPDLPPVADFIMNKAYGTGIIVTDNRSYFLSFNNPASFTFRNTSWNDTISSVNWGFSNGATTPTSSSTGIVYNKFSVPGWVTVNLVATSNAGSDTLINTNAVYAADTTAINPATLYQQFTSPVDIANWPMFNYYNNQFKWEFYTGAGYDDNTCVRYRSYDSSSRNIGNAIGDFDDFYTPAFNLVGLDSAYYLNFYTAGSSTLHNIIAGTTRVNDSLEIDASINGGTKWTKIAGFRGSDLDNNGLHGPEYVPAVGATWKARAVVIPALYKTNQTYFRFRYRPGNTGNDLYLDNVYFYPFPAGVKETIASTGKLINLFPNPATNGCSMVFNTGNEGRLHYIIKDLTGKMVFEGNKSFVPNTLVNEEIPRAVTPNAGMYFITATIDGLMFTDKLVVY